jgi:DNA-binding beta-propeller fold protein YncE
MTKQLLALAFAAVCCVGARGQTPQPISLVQTIEMPGVPVGPYTDHLAVDLKGHRLFSTPQAHHSVQVFDLGTGKFVHEIAGLGNPHAVLYRTDLDRIYVVDGNPGLLRIYDGHDYHSLQDVKLLPNADALAYDPATKLAYVTNGGKEANLDYSLLSIVDTSTGRIAGNITIPAGTLEALAIESSSPRIYINLTEENQVGVLDRRTRTVIARWALPQCMTNMAMALDEDRHRLFVGCRNTDMTGVIAVVDTQAGKELDTLPIGGWVDDLAWDKAQQRIYASCGTGYVYVYGEREPDRFEMLEKVETAVMAKTSLFVPELHRFFVAVPHIGGTPARVLVFHVS